MERQTTHIPQADIDRQLAYCLEVKGIYESRGVQPLAFVDTYGCQQNEADSERIRGYLREMGFAFTDKEAEADIIVINTCAVREHAEQRVLGNVGETDWRAQTRVADLNVSALTALTSMVIPYMKAGGRIINVSSIASFCPNPRMTVYSSSKAYVSAFSRSLGEELKGKGITVTAVCAGPMATDFLDTAGITGKSKTFEVLPYCDPVKVVRGSYAAARAGKAVHTPKAFYKLYRGIAKILPQCLMIKFTRT